MKKILISESQFMLLTEGAVDRTIKGYIKEGVPSDYVPYLNTPVEQLPEEIGQNLSAGAPAIYQNCLKRGSDLSQYFRLYFLSFFDIDTRKPDPGPYEYVRGIARIAMKELGMLKSNSAQSEVGNFKQIVMFMHRNKQLLTAEYNSDLNGLSYYDLAEQVDDIRREFNRKARESAVHFQNNKDYTVVPINSFKAASKYGKYTKWCITQEQSHFDTYTPCGERFYFCLRKGFKNVKKASTEGCPLDDYGLSMVSVRVDMDGEPLTITTRWNHDYDGENNERLKTREQVEEVLGIDFYGTFKPYSREELYAKGITPTYDVPKLLAQGVDPKEIFSDMEPFKVESVDYFRVCLNNTKFNILLPNNQLLNKRMWFDYIGYFHEGFAVLRKGEQYSFIDTTGNLIRGGTLWFDSVGNFHEGLAVVKKGKQWSFIDSSGKLIGDGTIWYGGVKDFCEGLASVQEGNQWSFIDTTGKLIGDGTIWYDWVGNFHEGLAKVEKGEQYSFIDTTGNLIRGGTLWFDSVGNFHEGLAVVKKGKQWSFIDSSGKLIGDGTKWYDDVGDFHEGLAVVKKGKQCSFIDGSGKLIGDGTLWYDGGWNFHEGLAAVRKGEEWSFIDTAGNLIGDGTMWFDRVESFHEGLAAVKKGNFDYYLTKDYKLFSTVGEASQHAQELAAMTESIRKKKKILISESQFRQFMKMKRII